MKFLTSHKCDGDKSNPRGHLVTGNPILNSVLSIPGVGVARVYSRALFTGVKFSPNSGTTNNLARRLELFNLSEWMVTKDTGGDGCTSVRWTMRGEEAMTTLRNPGYLLREFCVIIPSHWPA